MKLVKIILLVLSLNLVVATSNAQGPLCRIVTQELIKSSFTSHETKMKLILKLIDAKTVNDLQGLVKQLESHFPFEDNILIGIGRSPTPVVALLEIMGVKVHSLPLSKMVKNINGTIHPTLGNIFGPLPPYNQAALFKHFSDYLPALDVIGDKKLILVDYISSGRSLESAQGYIEAFYDGKVAVEMAPIVSRVNSSLDFFPDSLTEHQLLIKSSALNKLFSNSFFDGTYSKYPLSYDVMKQTDENNQTPYNAEINPAYQLLKERILKFVKY